MGDAIHFLFMGKLQKEAEIRIDEKEIKHFYWMKPADALTKFDQHLTIRVAAGLRSIEENRPFYCEEGQVVI